MHRISLGTIYGKIEAHKPRRIALVSQRLNPREEYEDGNKVVRLALRNRESAFAAHLTADGIRHETFAASDVPTRAQEIAATGAFEMCVIAGEVCSQSISIANAIRQAGFRGPMYLEMTEDEAIKKNSLAAAFANATRSDATDLLERFVYLTKSVRSPAVIEFPSSSRDSSASDPHPEFTAALMDTYRRAHSEADYHAPNFLAMLQERGGRDTALYLIHQPKPPAGFTALWERKRLDLAVEAIVLRREWWHLFSDADRAAAYSRLQAVGFDAPEASWRPGMQTDSLVFAATASELGSSAPPTRTEVHVSRINRDLEAATQLKNLYQYRYQLCGFRIETRSGGFYIQVHHVHPLGGDHKGLDNHENMLVLCPNHHALFDHGVVRFVSPTAAEVGGTIYPLTLKHDLSTESISYHNANCTG